MSPFMLRGIHSRGGTNEFESHSAKLNRLDPYAYIRDVLERLPTQPASRIGELTWQRNEETPEPR